MKDRLLSLDNADSFSLFYHRTHLHVFRFVYGVLGGPQEEVEDLTAETYLRAWRARRSFTGDEKAALGWVFQIARNLIVDHYRKRNVREQQSLTENVVLIDQRNDPEELITIQEQFESLWEAIHRLPIHHREIIVLRYVLNWPVYEIAGHLGIPENTVSVTIRRLIARLQKNHIHGNG
jgi:RNA polymerase sigma-70 factor, ECF subfamily